MGSEFTTTGMRMEGQSIMSSPVEATVRTDPVAENLSGIVLNQNGPASGSIPMTNPDFIWQTFRFPADYPRGVSGGKDVAIPKFCGFHVCLEVEQDHGPAAGLDWVIDYWHPIRGWVGLVKGTEVGSPGDGENVWFDVNFHPFDITDYWYRKFRLGIAGREGDPSTFRTPIPFNERKNTVTIGEEEIPVIPTISAAPLQEGETYWFQLNGQKPAMIEMLGGECYYSEQHGINSVTYTAPNPYKGASSTESVQISSEDNDAANEDFLVVQEGIPHAIPAATEKTFITIPRVVGSDIKTYQLDGVNPLVDSGEEVSLRFRILSTAPDSDRDCTGSLYRTVAIVKDPESVRSSVGELEHAYWLSAPNPSKFACESLYMDISDSGMASVVDHLLIDPVTPGIYMNVYYSNDPAPGATTDEWDGLLWTRVPKSFLLRRRESFALPEPIIAKYVKLEFTHLQPVWYSAGTFQLPTAYRKHPKWVMDYYLALYEHVRAGELEAAPTVNVTFDALDLAYNYYLDDIRQDAALNPSATISSEGVSLLTNFLTKEQEAENNEMDPTTLLKISTALKPYTSQPSQQSGTFGSLLQTIVNGTAQIGNYPTEATNTQLEGSASNEVSSLERDSLIVEKQFPVTNFFITCRHYYMTAEAFFEEDRAYFAGIKEVSLTREHYSSRYDADLYIETVGDDLNIDSNDLFTVDHTWVTFKDTEEFSPSLGSSGTPLTFGLEPEDGLDPEDELDPY